MNVVMEPIKDPTLYRQFFQQIMSNLAVMDTKYRVIECTDQWAKTLTVTREQVIGKVLFDVFPEQVAADGTSVRPLIQQSIIQCMTTKQPTKLKAYRYDIWNDKLNRFETRIWTAVNTPIFINDQVEFVLHDLRDITEQMTLQSALETAKVFQLLVSNVKDYAIFMLDPKGNVKTWNEGAKRLNYYEEHEIIGKNFSIFYTQDDLVKHKPERELKTAVEQGKTEDENWRIRKDGSKYWADVLITAVYNDMHLLVGFAKVIRDLTERKMNEEKVIAAYEDNSRMKSEFLANMSHEIRTPMNGIQSAATLLKDTPLNGEQIELVNVLQESGQNLIKVINDILDYSKLETNDMQLTIASFDPAQEIENVGKNMRLINTKPIDIIVNAGNLPHVKGDAYRFRQIITHLMDNALKFTERGKVSLIAQQLKSDAVTEKPPYNVVLRIDVKDTGIGISEEDINKLFAPFGQLDLSTKKQYRGAGLGLSISKRLVELMNGEIHVESKLGEGSDFWFVVRLIKDDEQAKDRPLAAVPESPADADMSILVAEDNPINQNVVKRILKKLGYHNVDIAVDGQKAVDMFKNKRYDLILMDIQMPKMDGYEATQYIRQHEDRFIPIIAMTANALKGDAEKCLAAGMNDYLPKPLDFAIMSKTLNRWTRSNHD